MKKLITFVMVCVANHGIAQAQNTMMPEGALEVIEGGETVLVNGFQDTALSPLNILMHWPVCEIPSSLGQVCKMFDGDTIRVRWEDIFSWWNEFGNNPVLLEITDSTITITKPDDWYYTYRISETSNNNWKVYFYDDAIWGTYLTSTEFEVSIVPDTMVIQQLSVTTW